MLAVYAGMLVLIGIVILVTALKWLASGESDRLAVIGNLLSLGTLLLALVAGIVALAGNRASQPPGASQFPGRGPQRICVLRNPR
jgi:hypothetical protein